MTKQGRRVLIGYTALTDADRQEVDAEIDKFKRGDFTKRRDLRESYQKSDAMDLGPAGSGCPCCGR